MFVRLCVCVCVVALCITDRGSHNQCNLLCMSRCAWGVGRKEKHLFVSENETETSVHSIKWRDPFFSQRAEHC